MTPILATIDPWILAFSAVTVFATIWMGIWAARKSKTASDFYVAGRSVSVGWNASAISGEYLSAASFMGVAGMVMSSGYDALWYPVCYACGYLFLLLFIAGPLRRFGAYTVPDLAEGRFDSPLFRKIAVVFVLFIGFFYTMPQMKGAGTTLAYIFPGLPYWVGVALVGTVITLNVALGGMKAITLVQAFQYWAKMFAISVPIFVLMAVYGHYGKQLGANGNIQHSTSNIENRSEDVTNAASLDVGSSRLDVRRSPIPEKPPKDEEWEAVFLRIARDERPYYPNGLMHVAGLRIGLFRTTAWRRPSQWTVEQMAAEYANCRAAFGRQTIYVERSIASNNIVYPGVPINTLNESIRVVGGTLRSNGIVIQEVANRTFKFFPAAGAVRFAAISVPEQDTKVVRHPLPEKAPADSTWLSPFGPLTTKAAKAAGISAEESKPYSLLYTYSLIIALVCGTAGLPHILVRFYTNPDGVAAKRTTMWVMILIGTFYVFPPIFGVMGRNLLPELYSGVGAKGTDKVVLELPRILNKQVGKSESEKAGGTSFAVSFSPAHSPTFSLAATNTKKPSSRFPWGSILSGVTCAGAFAAFMSTFSGLLVSMTGAMAHDVYGRMLNPKATGAQRLRAFKIASVIIGAIAILLGMQVETLEINFMVGQAFAIAAASYFPFLFMCAWWRNLTMKGAATGMLTGGLLALAGITLTSISDIALKTSLAKGTPNPLQGLQEFWAGHPGLRIICEQPAIWAVPLAIGLMVVVSKLTRSEVPKDIRMKMLVLHAPEKLGLKQEYIQEHQHGH